MPKVTEAASPELEVDLPATLKTLLFPQEKKDLQRADPGPAPKMGVLILPLPCLAVWVPAPLCYLV